MTEFNNPSERESWEGECRNELTVEKIFLLTDKSAAIDTVLCLLEEGLSGNGLITQLLLDYYRGGLKHGLEIGLDRCALERQRLDKAFRLDWNKQKQREEANHMIRIAFEHIIASPEELVTLQQEFPEQEFAGHHVKCPQCWHYYRDLQRHYSGG